MLNFFFFLSLYNVNKFYLSSLNLGHRPALLLRDALALLLGHLLGHFNGHAVALFLGYFRTVLFGDALRDLDTLMLGHLMTILLGYLFGELQKEEDLQETFGVIDYEKFCVSFCLSFFLILFQRHNFVPKISGKEETSLFAYKFLTAT